MGIKAENIRINGIEYTLGGSGSDIDVIDNLNTEDSSSALSANQGKVLNDKIEMIEGKSVVAKYDEETEILDLEFNVPTQGIIEDTLNSTNKYNALSANQGKILNDKINNINSSNTDFIQLTTTIGEGTGQAFSVNSIYYIIRNGICYVNFNLWTNSVSNEWVVIGSGLPIPVSGSLQYTVGSHSPTDNSSIVIRVNSTGDLIAAYGARGFNYVGTISYPIAL